MLHPLTKKTLLIRPNARNIETIEKKRKIGLKWETMKKKKKNHPM